MKNEIDSLGFREYRLDFTVESFKEVKEILSEYNSVFRNNERFNFKDSYTRGHLKRGVE